MADLPDRPVRSGRGMTTRGRCLLAGGLAAAICAFLLDERDLLRVGILAVVLPLAAYLLTATRRPKLEATHQVLPDRLSPGTVGQVTLTLTNAGATRTRTVELMESPTPGLTAGMRCLLPGLRRGRSAQATYRLYATGRGRFQVGPPHVRFADPFALWEDVRNIDSRAEVLVVPSAVRLAGLPAGSGNRSAASGRAAVGSVGGDPDVAIRNYRNGDDIRTIHWRASARHDDLMVRLEEPVSHGGAVVLLDNRQTAHRGAGVTSSFETAVTMAASVSLHLVNTDHEVKLTSHNSDVIAHGHDISDDVLAGLAVIELDDDNEIDVAPVGTAGMLIAVLGDIDPSIAGRLIAGKPRGVQAIALMLEVGAWAGPGDPSTEPAAAGRQLLAAGGWRTVNIRPGDDLAEVWRQACQSGDSFTGPHSAGPGRRNGSNGHPSGNGRVAAAVGNRR
ncbi:DUF58 domain-containing protein [Nakamurella lactea]|uniref:DUF58 domain-containing protein n=1 Tax=Nakamurella lactea TaxID=459515 RepID=UPI000416FA0F|nr:DUF58 domain-containing protein [Nakamurella lactea]